MCMAHSWRHCQDLVFHDPEKLLSGQKFFAHMILLVEPMVPKSIAEIQQDDFLSNCLDVAAVALYISSPFAIILVAAGVSLIALKFLYGTYKKIPLSAHYLGAYITDLTCILHLLFQEVTGSEQPKDLTQDLISNVRKRYKKESFSLPNRIREIGVLRGFGEKIAELIREETETLKLGDLTDSQDSGEKRRLAWRWPWPSGKAK